MMALGRAGSLVAAVAAVALVQCAAGAPVALEPTETDCNGMYYDENACNGDAACIWCDAKAVPSACYTTGQAKTLPPAVFTCSRNADVEERTVRLDGGEGADSEGEEATEATMVTVDSVESEEEDEDEGAAAEGTAVAEETDCNGSYYDQNACNGDADCIWCGTFLACGPVRGFRPQAAEGRERRGETNLICQQPRRRQGRAFRLLHLQPGEEPPAGRFHLLQDVLLR